MNQFKIFNRNGELQATTPHAEIAAMVVNGLESGAQVSYGRKSNVVWVEGGTGYAVNSFDLFAEFVEFVIDTAEVTFKNMNSRTSMKTNYTAARGYAAFGPHREDFKVITGIAD